MDVVDKQFAIFFLLTKKGEKKIPWFIGGILTLGKRNSLKVLSSKRLVDRLDPNWKNLEKVLEDGIKDIWKLAKRHEDLELKKGNFYLNEVDNKWS